MGMLFSTWGSINHCSQAGEVCISMTINGIGLFCFLGEKNNLLLVLLICAGQRDAVSPGACPLLSLVHLHFPDEPFMLDTAGRVRGHPPVEDGMNGTRLCVSACVVQRHAPSGGLVQVCASRKCQGDTSKSAQGALFIQQHWT